MSNFTHIFVSDPQKNALPVNVFGVPPKGVSIKGIDMIYRPAIAMGETKKFLSENFPKILKLEFLEA